jgi:hypothetical protein
MNRGSQNRTPQQTYQVPTRFGAGGLLAIIFVFSVVFGGLHRMDAHGGYYLFFAVLGLVVGMSQMRGAKSPRWASVIAGAVVLPPSIFVAIAFEYGLQRALFSLPMCLISMVLGAGIGYLAGALLGGAFLIADYLEQYFDPREKLPPSIPLSEIVMAEDITELRERQKRWLIEKPPE